MANVIKLKQGSGSNPQASDLVLGELAIRTDGTPKLFALNDAGNVVGLGGAPDDGSITSAKIADGAIVNADINASAAIAGSKISPSFTSNITTTGELSLADKITITGTAPKIVLTDSDHNSDFRINVGGGVFQIEDATNSFADRFTIASDGTTTVAQNLDVGAGIDVTGNIETTGMLKITSTAPHIDFIDTNGAPDFRLLVDSNYFQIYDINNAETRFKINTDGHVDIAGNLDCAAGVDVTGNITVTGTVDGVDIAARDTLFGGLTSSSGVLSNGVTATTQSASDNSTKVATTAYTDTAISNLVDSSPSTLNTLNELAAALGDDANFSTTVTNSIATKMPLSGGTFTGNITISTVTPEIIFDDTTGTPDYKIRKQSGHFMIMETGQTNDSEWRFSIRSGGTINIPGNLDVGAGIDVTGAMFGTVSSADSTMMGLTANMGSNNNRSLIFKTPATDSSSEPFRIQTSNSLQFDVDGEKTLFIDSSGQVNLHHDGSTDAKLSTSSTGVSVSGNIISTAHITGVSDSSDAAFIAKGDGSSQDGYIQLNCSQNSHGIKLASPAHSAGASYTFTFPSSIVNNGVLKTDGSANTSFGLIATANIADDAVTNSKLENMATQRIMGRTASGSGNPQHLTAAEARSVLNVEDGATADQTASEILTLVKTVDGSGSGLDADTLDGIDSSNFLRSNADDEMFGLLTLRNSNSSEVLVLRAAAPLIRFQENGTNKAGIQWVQNGYLSFSNSEDGSQLRLQDDLKFSQDGSTFYSIWHAGNDGASSGLDSDLLDGQQGSYYLNYSNFTNTPTVPTNNNQLTNGAGYITSAALAGASDGGNAALLDGIDSTQFLRSDADDSTSGILSLTSNSQYPLKIDGNDNGKIVLQGSSEPYIRFKEGTTDKAFIQWNADGYLQLANQESGEYLRIKSGSNGLVFLEGGSEKVVYHTGNLPTIPTNNNQLTNGAGYITSASFSDVAGGGTFTGDVTFSGGANSVSIAANSDIRLNSGSWTGNSGNVMKIQGHDNALYIVGGTNGIRFREDGTDRWFIDGSGHLIPASTNTYNLGATGNRIQNLYVNDMHFSNEGKTNDVDGSWGDWTLQEGEEDIFMINNRSGKKFKIAMIPV